MSQNAILLFGSFNEMSNRIEPRTLIVGRSKKLLRVLFSPKRGKAWYRFEMITLYLFSLVSVAAAIGVLVLSDIDPSEKTETSLIFFLASTVLWFLARRCSRIVAQVSSDHGQDNS